MFYVALNGRIEALEAFIAAGANVWEQDVEGATPMFYAASGGHTQGSKTKQIGGCGCPG